MRPRLIPLILASITLAAAGLSAQERFGALAGRVTDQQDMAVPGVTVSITNAQTEAVRSFVTGDDGRYLASDLAPGRYVVRFELPGFVTVERDDVGVTLGRTFEVDAQMRVGEITEVVQVTADAVPLVDTTSTLVAHNVPIEEIEGLPKTRSYQSVAMTAPSVNSGELEGGFQVNGASGSENQYTVDGVPTNSLLNGGFRQSTVFEYLQEVQVKTVGIPAEYGGALGGVVSAVTRSGGNVFTGEAHYYYLGSALSAAPNRRLVLSPIDDVTVAYVQDLEQPSHHNELGFSLGGPIVPDSLFFFGSISPRLVDQTYAYGFNNGAEIGDIARDQTVTSAYGKVSYAGPRVNAYFGTLWTPTTSRGTLPAYNGFAPNELSSTLESNLPNRDRGYEIDQRSLTGHANLSLSRSAFLSVDAGHFHDRYQDTGVPSTTPVEYYTSSIGLAGVPADLQGGVGFQNTPGVQIVEQDLTTQTYVQADFNTSFEAAGRHSLKVGGGIRHNANDVEQRYPGGEVRVYWDETFSASGVPGVAPGRGAFGYYAVHDVGTFGEASADISHLYAQDQWQMRNLTLNVGVRLEREAIPTFRPDIQDNAFVFGWGDKVAPRIGAAYDLRGDGRVKIFGSYGRYYDWTKYELSRGSFGADIWRIHYRTLDDPTQVFGLSLDSMPGTNLWNPADPDSFQDNRQPSFDTIDPGLKPMSQDSFNVGVEHQLGDTAVLSVGYVHNNLVRTIEDMGLVVDGNVVFLFANPGEGQAIEAFVSSATPSFEVPKAKRQYDALQVSLNRRFADNWFFGGSYVLSRLYGNYAGLQNSDEILTPTLGSWSTDQQQAGSVYRFGGNVNVAFDLDQVLWDANGNLNPTGRLATDRPHVVKLFGSYLTSFGTQIGLNFYAASGTPLTTSVNTNWFYDVFVEGRGDLGRTPALSYTDLLVAHELRLGGSSNRVRLELNVLNLFNQQTARHRFGSLNRWRRGSSQINLGSTDLSQGYDYQAMIAATSEGQNAFDPRYGLDDLFTPGRSGHVLVKWLF
jgi:hypothetical protein